MIITYHGFGFVKIQVGDKVVAFNPIGKEASFKAARFGSDLALISLNDSYYNGVETVTFADKVPLTVDGPGEYEIGDIFVRGLLSAGPAGELNTIYGLELDGIKLVHLGAMVDSDLSPAMKEELGEADVVFAPADGRILDPRAAARLAFSLNPKLVIPVNHGVVKGDADLNSFLKEAGVEKSSPVDKLVIKKKDLVDKEGEVIVVKSF